MVELGDTRVLLDAGRTDLATVFRRDDLAAVLLTHFHVDHVQGLFHLRWGVGEPLPVYCPDDDEGCADLYKHPGLLAFSVIRPGASFQIGGLEFTPLPMQHSKLTYGYMIRGDGRAAYLTDTRGLSDEAARALREFAPEVVVVDAKYPPGHVAPKGHNTIDEALSIGFESGASRVILTHLGHEAEGWLMDNPEALPPVAEAGRDGQVIETARAEAWI
jgi:phosphoribosyl 1,2-cyclic phosphate phosphodiesterase